MKIKIHGLDEYIYYEKLDNGLEIFLKPYSHKKNYIMNYVVKFGSLITEFTPAGKKNKIKVPDGIAHFLEHKMFEQEDGIDPFTFASKSGTYSNAATNFDSTRYYFEGNKNFKENLEYLINFVGSPYFTDDNVEKEKGIIKEEIKQYDDDINWFLEEEIYKSLLHTDNHRIDIAGTIESVDKITKDDLYEVYNSFYYPNNMFIVITGNFKIEEALEVIKNNEILKSKKSRKNIIVDKKKEKLQVKCKQKSLRFNINNKKMAYSIKIPINDNDRLLLKLYTTIMLELKFGNSSLFREQLKEKEMYTKFVYGCELIDDYLLISFIADTNKGNVLIKMIKEELDKDDIIDADINRIKKVLIASDVMASDDVNYTNHAIVEDIICYGKVINNRIDIYRSLNINDYKKIRKKLNFDNDSTIYVKPLKKV